MKEDVKCEELNPTEYLTADEFWEYKGMKDNNYHLLIISVISS